MTRAIEIAIKKLNNRCPVDADSEVLGVAILATMSTTILDDSVKDRVRSQQELPERVHRNTILSSCNYIAKPVERRR